MIYLMKLEIRKLKLLKYIRSICITIAILIGMSYLMMYTSKEEQDYMFETTKAALIFIDVLVRGVFLIFSSVILGKLTVEEYRNRTIQMMFCYPISRKKLMYAKLGIVYLFTVITTLLADMIIIPTIAIISNQTGLLQENFTISTILGQVPSILLGAVLAGFVALVPFYFGMRKKSMAVMIVSSIVLTSVLTSSFGDGMSKYYGIRIFIVGVLSLLVVLFTMHSKIDKLQAEDL